MISGMRVLALVPARGGSKGIKNKNLRLLDDKPLIAHTLIAAKKSRYIDSLVVSTDSREIAETALDFGAIVPFLRPENISGDRSKTIETVLHTLDHLEQSGERFDILVLLQPTSPLREVIDIDCALELFVNSGYKGVVSVSETREHPILLRRIKEDGTLEGIRTEGSTIRRQDMDRCFKVNGALYINLIKDITEFTSFNDNKIPYIMPYERSIDIDEPFDLEIASLALEYFRNLK